MIQPAEFRDQQSFSVLLINSGSPGCSNNVLKSDETENERIAISTDDVYFIDL